MNLLEKPVELRASFALWQAMRVLGFEPEQMDVGITESGRIVVQITAGTQGFGIAVGSSRMRPHDFQHLWEQLAEALPSIPEAVLKANYEEFVTQERWKAIMTSLIANGVEIPAQERTLH